MNTRTGFPFLHFVLAIALSFSLALGQVSPASAALRCYVKAGAGGLNTGTSWVDAFISLQSALGASPCTEVWVARGTYEPTSGTNRAVSFVLKNGVALYGGFAGNETLLTQRNPSANPTILSGNIGATGSADNSYHVVRGSTTNGTARLDGFTITGGNANGASPSNVGGGMYELAGSPTLANVIFSGNSSSLRAGGMYNITGSNPILTNVTFSGNSTGGDGGGMYNIQSNPSLAKVTFKGNSAGHSGGGMFNWQGSMPSLLNVIFSGNHAAEAGGGIDNVESSPSLANVTFNHNSAGQNGGGMFSDTNCSPRLRNVTFSGNTAAGLGGGIYSQVNSNAVLTNVTFNGNSAVNGGGMYNENNSNLRLLNVTFSGNSATNGGGGMYNDFFSNPIITNSILYSDPGGEIINNEGSAANVSFSIVEGGYPGIGNLNVDPLLRPLGNYGGFTRTTPLGFGSPAIDKGTNTGCPAKDQRGIARPQDGDGNGIAVCDMGATESRFLTKTFQSVGAQDGWVLESTGTSGVGGTMNATAETFSVGDSSLNQQGISILSFNTASVPDTAIITSAVLKIKRAGLKGTNPFTTLGNLLVDVRKGAFSSNAALQLSDFQALANKYAAITILNNPVNGWYSRAMPSANFIYLNKTGLTQFRLRFAKDDNDNGIADYLEFYSGNYLLTPAWRPQLIVKYYMP